MFGKLAKTYTKDLQLNYSFRVHYIFLSWKSTAFVRNQRLRACKREGKLETSDQPHLILSTTGKGKNFRWRRYSLGNRKPFQGEVEPFTNGAIPSKLSEPQRFFSLKLHGPRNPQLWTRYTNLVIVVKRCLGWEATENYVARWRMMKYGCHWDKVNFEVVLTDVLSKHTLFWILSILVILLQHRCPKTTVPKCTFFALVGIVIKLSTKRHLGRSLQTQAKFSIQLIVFSTSLSRTLF